MKDEEHEWHIELDYMQAQLRWVLNNLDSIEKRNDVKGKIEVVCSRLNELCKLTEGREKQDENK